MNAPEPRDRAAAPEMVAPQRDRQAERTLAGVALAVLAVACFATLDTATKVAVATVPIPIRPSETPASTTMAAIDPKLS